MKKITTTVLLVATIAGSTGNLNPVENEEIFDHLFTDKDRNQ